MPRRRRNTSVMLKTSGPWLFGLLATVLFALALLGSSSFQKCVNEYGAEASEHEQNGSSSPLSAVNEFLDATRLSCVGHFVRDAHEEILAAFTVLLAFFTLALWKSTSDIARDAKESAARTLKTMENTAERQLKAYVAVYESSISNIAVDAYPQAFIVIKNSGQTPAYGLTGFGGIGIARSFDTLPATSNPVSSSLGVLAPGGLFYQFLNFNHVLTSQLYADLINGDKTLFVYGEFRYTDAFEKPRFLKYRVMSGGPVGVRGNSLASCEEGNDAN